jgi:hypothetical protein
MPKPSSININRTLLDMERVLANLTEQINLLATAMTLSAQEQSKLIEAVKALKRDSAPRNPYDLSKRPPLPRVVR